MKSFSYTIKNPQGLHARTAGQIAVEAMRWESSVKVRLEERAADAKDVMGLMGLYAACGHILQVEISGEDEEMAYHEIKKVMEESL